MAPPPLSWRLVGVTEGRVRPAADGDLAPTPAAGSSSAERKAAVRTPPLTEHGGPVLQNHPDQPHVSTNTFRIMLIHQRDETRPEPGSTFWSCSPAAPPQGSSGAPPSAVAAPPGRPVHPCSRRSDLCTSQTEPGQDLCDPDASQCHSRQRRFCFLSSVKQLIR